MYQILLAAVLFFAGQISIDSTRQSSFDFACVDGEGTVLSAHQRQDKAIVACAERAAADPEGVYDVQGGRWRIEVTGVAEAQWVGEEPLLITSITGSAELGRLTDGYRNLVGDPPPEPVPLLQNKIYADISDVYADASIPVEILNSDSIRTVSTDAGSASASLYTFAINRRAQVCVALDDDVSTPAWMSGYTDAGIDIGNGADIHSAFCDTFDAGTITLQGQNDATEPQYLVFTRASHLAIEVAGTPPANDGNYQFQAASFSLAENDTYNTATTLRVNGAEGAVSVDVEDKGTGTCTSGVDYNAITTGTRNWADTVAGNSTPANVSVTLNDVSADCTIIFGFTNPSAGFTASGVNETYTLTVLNSAAPADNDAEHGPVQISGGLCPGVPTGAADHTVTTEQQLLTALADLDGSGGIIEISDGTYSGWGNVEIIASGADEDSRIYVRSETLYGAKFGTGTRWNVGDFGGSDFITFSGFERTHGSGLGYEVQSNNVRIACHDVIGSSPSSHFIFVNGDNTRQWNDLEVDNNKFRNWGAVGNPPNANVWKVDKCNSQSAACLGTQQRHHIHHNSFQSNSATDQALYIGESFMQQSDTDYWEVSKEQGNHLIENNTFDWPGYDPTNVKSSRNIFRYNCFESGTRVPHTRSGHDNMWYANWFRGPPGTQGYDAGWGTFRVFNYINSASRPIAKLRSGQEFDGLSPERWAYISSSEGVYSNNVCDNCFAFVQQMDLLNPASLPQLVGAARKPLVINSLFQNNKIRSSGTPADYDEPSDSHTDETEFNSNNTFGSNVSEGSPKSSVACFTSSHVVGIGSSVTGSSRLSVFDGSIDYSTTIPAPSWW